MKWVLNALKLLEKWTVQTLFAEFVKTIKQKTYEYAINRGLRKSSQILPFFWKMEVGIPEGKSDVEKFWC